MRWLVCGALGVAPAHLPACPAACLQAIARSAIARARCARLATHLFFPPARPPAKVCRQDVDEVDHVATLANGEAMARLIKINTTVGASITSNHMRGKAVDMSIEWKSTVKPALGPLCPTPTNCSKVVPAPDVTMIKNICDREVVPARCTVPAGNSDTTEMWAVGASYGALHFRPGNDKWHWSVDGS